MATVELWVLAPKADESLVTPDPGIKEAEIIEDCGSEEPNSERSLKKLAVHNKGINRTRLQLAFYSRGTQRAGYAWR